MLAKLVALFLHSKAPAMSALFVIGTTGALVSATTQDGVTTIKVTPAVQQQEQRPTQESPTPTPTPNGNVSGIVTQNNTVNSGAPSASACAAERQKDVAAAKVVNDTFTQFATFLLKAGKEKGSAGVRIALAADRELAQIDRAALKAIFATGAACAKNNTDKDEDADEDADDDDNDDEDKDEEDEDDDVKPAANAANMQSTSGVTFSGTDANVIAQNAINEMTKVFNKAKGEIDALPTPTKATSTNTVRAGFQFSTSSKKGERGRSHERRDEDDHD